MGCASLGRQWWHSEGMRRPKRAMVARRGDAPAYVGNGGAARGCDGQNGQWWCGEGMRQPNGATPNRWVGGECAGKRRDQIGGECAGECAGQTEQHQIGGGSAGNAPAKRNNTKLVAARRGMRRPNGTTPNQWRLGGECAGQTEQHQIGRSAANAPANEEIVARQWDAPAGQRECGAAMRCAG